MLEVLKKIKEKKASIAKNRWTRTTSEPAIDVRTREPVKTGRARHIFIRASLTANIVRIGKGPALPIVGLYARVRLD